MKTGIEFIAEERQRQVHQEGWTPQHDDQHAEGELASAARCYLHELAARVHRGQPCMSPPPSWPFETASWKPKPDVVRQLAIVGALVAAEIDRLRR
jgi:hypothetical protein